MIRPLLPALAALLVAGAAQAQLGSDYPNIERWGQGDPASPTALFDEALPACELSRDSAGPPISTCEDIRSLGTLSGTCTCEPDSVGPCRCVPFYCRLDNCSGITGFVTTAILGFECFDDGDFLEFAPGARCVGHDPEKEDRSCPQVANPVNPVTGNKHQVELDYRGAGPFPLTFRRYYSSQRTGSFTSLRDHWRHSFQRRVKRVLVNGVDTLRVVRDDGQSFRFQVRDGEWRGDPDVLFTVSEQLDALGLPTGYEVTTPEDAREVFDVDGRLLSVTRRDGLGMTFEYDTEGRLAAVEGPFGRRLTVEHDAAGRLGALVDPAGGRVEYEYDEQDRLVLARYPDDTPAVVEDAPVRQYFYEDTAHAGALTRLQNENGVDEVVWSYDARGRAVSSVRAGETDVTLIAYNADGSATVTDALGNVRTFRHTIVQAVRRLTAVEGGPCTACGASSAARTYDASGFLASRTDFNGNTTTLVHDARGLEVSRTEAVGTTEERTILTDWHPQFRVPVRITGPGQVTEFEYDAIGRLLTTTVTDPVTGRSRTTTRTYGADDLLASVDGPRVDVADVTLFEYVAGNLSVITNALGQQSIVTDHDPHGRPTRLVDANGLVTELRYDPRGRLVERIVDGLSTGLAYDAVGNLLEVLLPDGGVLRYGYDAANRLVSIEDALGNRIEYALDPAGNRVGEDVLDPAGLLVRTRSRVYDDLGQLVADTGGEGQATTFEYDLNGNLTAIVDGKTQRTSRDHDALDRLVAVTDPAGGVTDFAYDARDNLVAVTDPRGLTTSYVYDGLDDLVEQTSPDTGLTRWTTDAAGNPVSRTDARGVAVEYRYDALGRLLEVLHPDPAEDIVYTYDTAPNGIGRLATMQDPSGTTAYEYDLRGNLTAETRTLGTVSLTTRFEYDAVDRIAAIVYPSGARVVYRRDAAGQLAGVDLERGGVTTVLADGVAHAPFGPVSATTFGNGLAEQRRYDLDGRPIVLETSGVLDWRYSYDANANVLAIDDLAVPGASQQFGYDTLDRLTSASGGYGLLGYSYDAAGNRTARSGPGGEDVYSVDPASNRLLAVTGPSPDSYAHDAAGNVTARGGYTLRYGDRGRLLEASVANVANGPTTTFAYNAKGERTTRTGADGSVTHFVFGPGGELLAELDGDGAPVREYVHADGRLLAQLARTPPDGFGYRFAQTVGTRTLVVVIVPDAPRVAVLENGVPVLDVSDGLVVVREPPLIRVVKLLPDGSVLLRADVYVDTQGTAQFAMLVINDPNTGEQTVLQSQTVDTFAIGGGQETVRYYHLDHLGTPQALTDEAGTVVWQGRYQPFGTVHEVVADAEQPVRMPGQFAEEGVGGYYNYYRFYDPSSGRYLRSDPIGLAGGIGTYLYALGNPIRLTDPTGLQSIPSPSCFSNPLECLLRRGLEGGPALESVVEAAAKKCAARFDCATYRLGRFLDADILDFCISELNTKLPPPQRRAVLSCSSSCRKRLKDRCEEQPTAMGCPVAGTAEPA